MGYIYGPVTNSITLVGKTTPPSPGVYTTPFRIGAQGSVEPSGGTAAAVYSSYAGVMLSNYGTVLGTTGSVSSNAPATEPTVGGVGIDFAAEGVLLNHATIKGGTGSPAAGGAGVVFSNGAAAGVDNRGKIYGGYAGGPTVSPVSPASMAGLAWCSMAAARSSMSIRFRAAVRIPVTVARVWTLPAAS